MGSIFYIIGRSASGKDKIFRALRDAPELALTRIVRYTTRPVREREKEGVQYHFLSDEELDRFEAEGKVIEEERYETVHGLWRYATIDDGAVDLAARNYLMIGTIHSFTGMRDYYGADKVHPVFIDVREDNLLERALKRERKQAEPKYKELCRRFLADSEDFSEENIRAAGIEERFDNNGELADCIAAIRRFILERKTGSDGK